MRVEPVHTTGRLRNIHRRFQDSGRILLSFIHFFGLNLECEKYFLIANHHVMYKLLRYLEVSHPMVLQVYFKLHNFNNIFDMSLSFLATRTLFRMRRKKGMLEQKEEEKKENMKIRKNKKEKRRYEQREIFQEKDQKERI